MKNPTITIHETYTEDGVPHVRYTATVPRENGDSLYHGIAIISEPIEIPLNE